MLDQIVDQKAIVEKQNMDRFNALMREETVDRDGRQVWKMVMVTEFPNCAEVFIDEAKETWSDGANFEDLKEKTKRGQGDHARSKAVAARRAKSQVRKRCKMLNATQMLTLTYRENMEDFGTLQKHFKLFIKRLREYGEFEYVACVEKQKRGALHMHLAISGVPKWMAHKDGGKVKSYNLLRSVWRGVVGLDNGNIDLTKPRRNAFHRIASYIGKYIAKSIEGSDFNAKTYWASRGIPKPKVTKHWFRPEDGTTADLVALVASDMMLRLGYTDIAQYGDTLNQFHWFAFGKPSVH